LEVGHESWLGAFDYHHAVRERETLPDDIVTVVISEAKMRRERKGVGKKKR
jgi:hypothetical protein